MIALALTLVCVFYLLECTRRNFNAYKSNSTRFTWRHYKFNATPTTLPASETADSSSSELYRFDGEFRTRVTYKPPDSKKPIVIDPSVTNAHNCTPSDPRKCKTNDATSCFGCKNLTSRCTHLSTDTEYKDPATGTVKHLPKNESPEDGYCLSVKTLAKICHPLHGKFALIVHDETTSALASKLASKRGGAIEDFSEEEHSKVSYNLLCVCNEPGYIGNLTLAGACTDPFICDGKVDNINKPLRDIKCKCDATQMFKLINNVPTCQPKLVISIEPEDIPERSNYVPKDRYHKTIAGNFGGETLPNPCIKCPVSGIIVGGHLTTDRNGSVQCVTGSETLGVPIRRFKDVRLLNGSTGPDAILAISNFTIDVYGYMHDTTYPTIGVNFKRSENEKFCDALKMKRDEENVTFVLEPYHQVTFPGNFTIESRLLKVPNLKLVTSGFSYYFRLDNPTSYDSLVTDNKDPWVVNILQESLSPFYMWKREAYDYVQIMKPFVVVKDIDGMRSYVNNQYLLANNVEAKNLKFLFFRFDFAKTKTLVMMTAKTTKEYNEYRAKLIKLGECGIVRGDGRCRSTWE